jgi:hypothetical protein
MGVTSDTIFRYADPVAGNVDAILEWTPDDWTPIPAYEDISFTTSINFDGSYTLGSIDVLANGVPLTNPTLLNGKLRDFDIVNGKLTVNTAGNYVLRKWYDVMAFERFVIPLAPIQESVGPGFQIGVPFYPEILSRPAAGIARIGSDRKSIAYLPKYQDGRESFSYRFINIYGQVSEPACIFINIRRQSVASVVDTTTTPSS